MCVCVICLMVRREGVLCVAPAIQTYRRLTPCLTNEEHTHAPPPAKRAEKLLVSLCVLLTRLDSTKDPNPPTVCIPNPVPFEYMQEITGIRYVV